MPALLFWQQGFLALVAGIIASRHLEGGLACALVLLVVAGPKLWNKCQTRRYFVLLCSCFPAGWALGLSTEPQDYQAVQDTLPAWFQPAKVLRFHGEVVSVTGQPDRRLRVLLQHVRPASEVASQYNTPAEQVLEPLPGLVNFSWDQGNQPDGPRPLPGQTVTITTKLMPVTGFANEGAAHSTAYWAARDVRINAWTASGKIQEKAQLEISGKPSYFALLREQIRQAMVAALGGSALSTDSRFFARQNPKNSGETEGALNTTAPMSQAAAILPALLFGDRYGLDTATLDLFVRANLVHSLALSGQHLALAGLSAAFVVWLSVMASRGALLLYAPRRTLTLSLSMALALLYLWMGNAPLSLIRAALMMGFALLLLLAKRPSTLLDILFMAGASMVVVWPQAVFDLSVQLSVLSVAGIALSAPLLNAVAKRPSTGLLAIMGKAVILMIITSLAVQITTLPIVLNTFGRVSPFFLLNVLWLPLLEFIVLPLAALGAVLLAALGPQAASGTLFQLAGIPAQGIIDVLTFLHGHDGLPVWQGLKPNDISTVGYAAAVLAFAITLGAQAKTWPETWPKTWAETQQKELVPAPLGLCHSTRLFAAPAVRFALCAAILLPVGAIEREVSTFFTARDNTVTLRMLDVGQGQSLVVEWTDGRKKRLLLDGGGSTSPRFDTGRDIVAHALTSNRPPQLDIMMASHADMDHTRGLLVMADLFVVDEFMRSSTPFESGSNFGSQLEQLRQKRGIPRRLLSAGDTVELNPGLRLEVLHPPQHGRPLSSNNSSLIVRLARLEQGSWRGLALLCGDAQGPALRAALKFTRNPPTGTSFRPDLQAEVLLIPHHGSRTSLLPEFYDAVAPRLALISSGLYNSFGFPSPLVLNALDQRNIHILNSATHGEVQVTWKSGAPLLLKTFR